MAGIPVTDKWGLTQVKINKCSYTWTISNFSYLRKKTGEELESPCFSMGTHDESKWCLRLYLKGINENFKDYLSLYLYRKSGVEFKLDGQYKLSILSKKRGKIMEQTEECQYNKNYSSWGFPGFVKNELLKDETSRILVDDTITFHCEITVAIDIVSISSENSKTQRHRSSDVSASLDFEKLFLDEKFSDVKLVTPCGRSIPAHKNILAARSPIFSAMFEHDMVESKSNVVEIADVEHDVLKDMLRFIYSGKVENVENAACGLLAAADKYGIEGLKSMCEEVLCDTMSVDNVVDVLVVADRHNIGYLKARALNFIKAHIGDVIESEGFKSMMQTDILTDIIRAIAL